MSSSVHLPIYATLFRGDQLDEALEAFAAKAMHYGATGWAVYRYKDDPYKFLVSYDFESKDDWDRYWNGDDGIEFRIRNKGRFQVPLLYYWVEKTSDSVSPAPAA